MLTRFSHLSEVSSVAKLAYLNFLELCLAPGKQLLFGRVTELSGGDVVEFSLHYAFILSL